MEDLLIEVLETLGYPVILQGSMSKKYPHTFFTFWNPDSYDNSHYDNTASTTVFAYDVNIYSEDPEAVYTELRKAIKKLKEAGFIVSGDGYGVASDEPTHDGRSVHVKYVKNNRR